MIIENFAPRKQLNMHYVTHALLVIRETYNKGGSISGNESTAAF